jgi:AAA domain
MLYDDLTLLSTQELLRLPPTEWLLEGLIPKEGFVGLFGQPSGGKSFIALDWAMCISEGRSWLGAYPCKQAPVIYVAAEGGRGIQKRAAAWMKHYGYRDLQAMYWLLSPLYVREEGTVEKFIEMLEDIDVWPGLIVLDTLSRSFGGGEENASADMGHFVDQITKLAVGRRMAALIVHHTNVGGKRERGSTAFRGAADAMFGCYAEKDPKSGRILRIELKNDKQKDGAEAPPIYVRPMDEVTTSLIMEITEGPDAKEPGPKEATPMRKADMMKVLAASEQGMTWQEWRLATGIDKSRFNRRLKRLIDDSEIIKENGRYCVMPATLDLAEMDDED